MMSEEEAFNKEQEAKTAKEIKLAKELAAIRKMGDIHNLEVKALAALYAKQAEEKKANEGKVEIQQEIKENTKEGTIREYAKVLGIPLKFILDDFQCLGLPCKAEDIVNYDMRSRLLSHSFGYKKTHIQVKAVDTKSEEKKVRKEVLKTKKPRDSKALKIKMDIKEAKKKAKEEEKKKQKEYKAFIKNQELENKRKQEEQRVLMEMQGLQKKREQEELITSIEQKASLYAETISTEILEKSLENLKKIGKIIEIFINLCPDKIKKLCK